MSNEIVRYSNQFNAQALRRFTALDLDLLMAIAARVRDKEIDEVTFTFEELRRLAHVKKNLTDKELAGWELAFTLLDKLERPHVAVHALLGISIHPS